MAETVRIEIPIETVDNTDPELSNVTRNFERMGKAAENANSTAKKTGDTVTQFDRQAQKTEKDLAKWAKEKYEVLLEAKDRVAPVLSTLGDGLRSFTGKTWNVTMRAVDFITSPVKGVINLLKNPVFQAGAVLGVSIGLKDTIDTYKGFEAAMSQVQAISGATGSDMAMLTDKAKEMGATTKFTAEESAEAFNYMAMAGWKTEDMMNGIEGILSLAAASGEDLATTSDIVTDALTAFGMKASDAGRFSDVLAAAASNANTTVSGMGETFKYAGAMAGALGYSIEDVAMMTGLMANTGIKGTMAGTALNAIFTRLSTNTNGAASAMSDLGVEFFTSEGNARGLSDVMGELRDATAGMTAEQKSQIANTIAGTDAQKGLLAILNASEEDYHKLADAIHDADGAAAGMSGTMLDNLQGSITLLQSAVDGVKISFGERLSPYVRSLADWLAGQMPEVEQGLNQFMDWIDLKTDRMKRRFRAVAGTEEWQEADFFGKVKIAWDEFIAEPFSEWWGSTGEAKLAGFAQNVGEGIGVGLKAGVMALLGIDLGETLEEGVSIGASFAKGFSEGFDFGAVSEKLWQGFKNLLSNAGKLLPGGEVAGLSSVLSAVLLGRIAAPLISMGKGAVSAGKIGRSIFASGEGNLGLGGSIAKGVSKLFGNFSVADEVAGTGIAGGSGLLGLFGRIGIALGSGATSSAGLIAAGAGSVLGGAAGLIHGGMDLYTGFTSDDAEKAAVYKKAGAIEVGGTLAGAGTGAAAGATIGALFGGIGAVPGALIGAGIGAVGSWIAGSRIKKDYQEKAEEMQKEAEKAQKVFDATGLSIEEATFQSEELRQAMDDAEVSAAQFALMFQKECADVAKKAFGDISLSLAEVKKVAGEIVFAGMAEELDQFSEAMLDTETALNKLKSSVGSLRKENWKVSLGMELSETDKDGYRGTVESFLKASQTFIDDNHYQATVALRLLAGGEADTAGLDRYYSGLRGQMEELGTQLSDSMSIVLEDSVITLNEAAELESLQRQISEITDKLASAKVEAGLQTLQIKHNGAALDVESFHTMQEELQTNVTDASKQYEDALNMTLTSLELQHKDGVLTDPEYDKAKAKAAEEYYARIKELNARVNTFSLESIAAAFGPKLDGILPEVKGTIAEKLSKALDDAILAHPDVDAWIEVDVSKWMGLDKLNLDPVEQKTIAKELIQTALAVPKGTKEAILQNFQDQIPTAEEIRAAIDWDSMTGNDWGALMESITGVEEGTSFGLSAEDAAKPMAEYYGEYFEDVKQAYSKALHDELERSRNNVVLCSFLEQYMPYALSASVSASGNGASEGLQGRFSFFREDLQTALEMATADPFTVSPTVSIVPDYHIGGSGFRTPGQGAHGYASGGYVSGGPQLSWLAEEGYGEFVIPTNPSRRVRALELYEQAGAALGVSAHAAGGYVGNSAFDHAVPNYDKEAVQTYVPVSEGRKGNVREMPVQVNVSMMPEFVIHADDRQGEEGIMQVIRRHMKEMADELGGEIAEKLEEVFSNMPLKEA